MLYRKPMQLLFDVANFLTADQYTVVIIRDIMIECSDDTINCKLRYIL